jgi:hypothetical protein
MTTQPNTKMQFPKIEEHAQAIVLNMMPHAGLSGVDLDSYAYRGLIRELQEDYRLSDEEVKLIDHAVRNKLRVIGRNGFGCFLEGEHR